MKRLLLACCLSLAAGCGGDKSMAEWVEQLKDRDSAQRLRAIRALERQSSEATSVVPALAICLSDPDAFVRRDAAEALGRFGPEARSATSALTRALRDKTPAVRKAAAAALKKLDGETASRAGLR
jgi:HEAT repeat protein